MDQNNLPGLPTVAALMLTAILSAWLGLWGPIDISKLEKWQTLMTGIIAVGAAYIAYRGAMAKVDYDRERELRDLARKRLGLYLRLRYAADKLIKETESVKKALGMQTGFGARKLSPTHIRITDRVEFNDAWTNLDLFPLNVSLHIDVIRTEIPLGSKLLDTYPENAVIEIPYIGVHYGGPLSSYLAICEKIAKSATGIVVDIDNEIGRMKLD